MALLTFSRPGEIVIGATVLSVTGIVASAGIAAIVRRRREARLLVKDNLPLLLAFLLFCLADWALLWALPHLRMSFSPDITLPLIVIALVRLLVFWGLLGATPLARWRGRRRGIEVRSQWAIGLFLLANLGLSAVQVDAYIIEPMFVETTGLSLVFDDLDPGAQPVRVVHLTDLHIERYGFREKMVIQKVNALQPDIIVLTGDYLNLSYLSDPTSAAHFRQFAAQLDADHGVYAVRGSVEPTLASMVRLVDGTDVVWLEQEPVTVDVRGQLVTLVGVACSHRQEVDTARLAQTMDGIAVDKLTLLLYHSPDLILEAAERQVDLYLGGHTHGGQLRLPVYGAIVTASMYGRRYASGLFEEGGTKMYISRGLGFEGGGLPRARFLCRPEIVSIELSGS